LALEESNQPHFLEALDGIPEITTAEQLRKDLVFRTIAKAWQRRFELLPPDRIFPRISYDPRLSFVFADFNSGKGSCRLAATQALMAIVLATEVEADGKMGPQTRAAMADLFDKFVIDESRKKEFQELLRTKNKPVWVSTQARSLAQKVYRANTGMVPPNHLVPNLWHGRLRQQMKGGSRLVSVEGYVSGSVSFFEDYYLRLATYTGRQVERPPSAAPRH
jgi:hypothetical protein